MKLTDTYNKFLKPNLDVLFVAASPSNQSNNHGHYFSSNQALFFKRLFQSGLIINNVWPNRKINADEVVFGTNQINYKNKKFGVIDVIKDKSNYKKISDESYETFLSDLKRTSPKIVVIMLKIIRDKIEKNDGISLKYGYNKKALLELGIDADIFLCPYPNNTSFSSEYIIESYSNIKAFL